MYESKFCENEIMFRWSDFSKNLFYRVIVWGFYHEFSGVFWESKIKTSVKNVFVTIFQGLETELARKKNEYETQVSPLFCDWKII